MEKQPDIVTVTLNPAIDQTVFIEKFVQGKVNRTSRHHLQAGGKGVNVSALLGYYGIPSIATGFLGKENDGVFKTLFRGSGVTDAFVRLPGETRTGIKIIDESTRETTDINFPGLGPAFGDLARFERKLKTLATEGRWFVVAGSLPSGLGIDFFVEILALLKSRGARIAVDTSGPALRAAIDGGADLIKPNEHELAEYLGTELVGFSEKAEAALEIQRTKVPHVILSLGGEGAIFVSPEKSVMASAPPVKVVSTVGAGDSLLAGYLAGLHSGLSPVERARLATVFAWSTLGNLTRELPGKETLSRMMTKIKVQPLSKLNF